MFFFGAPHSQHFAVLLLNGCISCIMWSGSESPDISHWQTQMNGEAKKMNSDLEHNDQRCTGNTYEWKGFIRNKFHNWERKTDSHCEVTLLLFIFALSVSGSENIGLLFMRLWNESHEIRMKRDVEAFQQVHHHTFINSWLNHNN